MEDLLLAKMKELTSRKDVSLQGDISAFKCMLESEERRLQDSRSQCNKKCSPCKPFLPPRASCSPMNQSSCLRAPAATSCPPVNLRSCPPLPISNPCKSLHQGCGTSSPALRSSLTPTSPLCCPPSSALTTRLPVYQGTCPPSSLASCLSAIRPNCFPPPFNLPCSPPSRLTCPPPSVLALCTSMSRSQCPSPRNSCPPVGPSANCRPTSSRPGTVVPAAYPKPSHPPEAPRFRQEQCVATDSLNDEPKTFFPMPPTHPSDSCKSGQGRDYFNMLIQDLNKDSNTNTHPVCKPLINECNNNMPIASATGNMKIIEVAPNGHFVRLLNISQHTEEDIGGFILQQNINGHPVTVYRFPPRTRVNAGAGLTVWAAAAKVPHHPPKDFLLKESNKFGTTPACTTILCKPNGQAVSWFTPAPGNSKLNDPCKDGGKFADYEHPLSTSHDTQLDFQPDKGKGETFANGCHFSPPALPMKPKPPVLTLPNRSPWSQSTACPTHPDYSIPRTQSLGNSVGSQCRDTRSQSARPDPITGNLNSGPNTSNQYRKNSSGKNDNKSSTQSAAPHHRGVLCMNPSPSASPLQQFYTETSRTINMPKQASSPCPL